MTSDEDDLLAQINRTHDAFSAVEREIARLERRMKLMETSGIIAILTLFIYVLVLRYTM